jgi:protein-L-isoaspartate(D-aspartate) O-methyltransferase
LIPDWAGERTRMVETQLRRRGIRDERVLAAMLQAPREEFVVPENRVSSYADAPSSIGYGQTISQPYMTALMAESLHLTGEETVLEVGSGSGYAAAVLGLLSSRVISMELVPALAITAAETLTRTGYGHNVTVIQGDGSLGCPQWAPFDAISVAAAAPRLPEELVSQLKDPGRLVIPVGDWSDQELRVVERFGGRVETRVATLCRFVPLLGGGGWR